MHTGSYVRSTGDMAIVIHLGKTRRNFFTQVTTSNTTVWRVLNRIKMLERFHCVAAIALATHSAEAGALQEP